MKKTALLFLLVFGISFIYAQTDDLRLDKSPNMTQVSENVESTMAPGDLLFSFPFNNFPLSYVAETDGNYFYVAAWDFDNIDTLVRKYDKQGNFIENLYIPGVSRFADFAYDGTYMYSGNHGAYGVTNVRKMDFTNQQLIELIPVSFKVRALAYDNDLDCFYGNNWSDAIKKFAPDGTLLDTMPLTGAYANYYGFAYDNWSAGGPYLWGFSQNGSNHHYIVQMELPSCTETGLVIDASYICWTIAGGLFTYPEADSGYAVIGGINQNCALWGMELAPIAPPQSFEVGGNITASTGTLDEGTVTLFKMNQNVLEDETTTDIDPTGSYLFPEVFEGDYLLQATPASSYINTHVPTYLGGQIHWDDASPVFLDDNSYDKDIELVEMAALGSGIGSVDGFVYELTTDAEIPVENAQLMLLNTSDECVAVTYTDSDGAFLFENIALDDYGLLVEIAGKTMEPMAFTLTQTSPQLSDVILYVSDNGITVGIDDDLSGIAKHIGEFYPNPSRDKASLDIRMEEAAELQLKVYAVSGQLVQDNNFVLSKGNNRISMMLSDLNSGVYYIILDIDNKFIATRKLIKN